MAEKRSNSRRRGSATATRSPHSKQRKLQIAPPSLARSEKKGQRAGADAAVLRALRVDGNTLLPLHRMASGRPFIATAMSGSAPRTTPTKSPSPPMAAKRTESKTGARTGFTARNCSRTQPCGGPPTARSSRSIASMRATCPTSFCKWIKPSFGVPPTSSLT